jgi:hypothetical protein
VRPAFVVIVEWRGAARRGAWVGAVLALIPYLEFAVRHQGY